MGLRRLVSTAALVACFAYVGACSDISESRARVQIRAPEPITTFTNNTTTSTTVDVQAMKTLWYAIAKQRDDIARFTAAATKNAETVRRASATLPQQPTTIPRAVSVPLDLADVVQCIKDHESGDYNEQSHPSDGSGAYQYIGPTWRAWSARAGYAGYYYAYQAPPEVQDAVLLFTLTNGGAHNWDSAFGNDPCTEHLP